MIEYKLRSLVLTFSVKQFEDLILFAPEVWWRGISFSVDDNT